MKNNFFYICNEQMDNIPLSIINKEGRQTLCIILNTTNRDGYLYYYIVSTLKDEEKKFPNFIIDNNGKILQKDVSSYQTITTWLQTTYNTSNLEILGYVYNIKENQLIPPSDTTNSTQTASSYYISQGIFINGCFMKDASYFFSYKNTFFIVDDNKLIAFSNKGAEIFNNESCQCIWINNKNVILFVCNYNCKEFTTNPIKSDLDFPIIICEASWLGRTNKICATKENIIISTLFSNGLGKSYSDVYFFSSYGDILWETHDLSIQYMEYSNSLLFIKYSDGRCVIYDSKGNDISFATSSFHKYMVFENFLSFSVPFNEVETNKAIDYNMRVGVLDTETGGVLIPPIYSSISIRETKEHVESIVTVTNYYNGIERKYQGLYFNENIIIPIGYNQITFLKYHSINNRIYEAPYILFMQRGKEGLVYENGTIIVDDCETIKLLIRKKDKSELPNYAVAKKKNKLALIYKDSLVSDFVLDDAEGLFPLIYENYDDDFDIGKWAKVWRKGKAALWFCGLQVSNFYKNIERVQSELFSNVTNTQNNFLFKITNDNNLKGIHDSKDNILLPCKYKELRIFNNCYNADGKYIDKNGTVFFNSNSYEFLDKAYGGDFGYFSFCYQKNDELLFIEIMDDIHNIIRFKRHDKEKSYEFGEFEFNFEKGIFEEKPDESFYHQQYPDDYDYERDTYYALGGSNYDEFKNNGGNLDDMMDSLGY